MRRVAIEKVVVNIGVGEAGERLLKAEKVLEMLTGQKAVRTVSRGTNRDFGIRRGQPIGVKVTLRGGKAETFLRSALEIRNNRLPRYSFDPFGNFSFGIPDHTDFPGMKYDPEIGVYGMDVSVVLRRPGTRVSGRRVRPRRIPRRHRIGQDEGMEWARERLGLEVIE
jgi:large subunit ribosomal protein L5